MLFWKIRFFNKKVLKVYTRESTHFFCHVPHKNDMHSNLICKGFYHIFSVRLLCKLHIPLKLYLTMSTFYSKSWIATEKSNTRAWGWYWRNVSTDPHFSHIFNSVDEFLGWSLYKKAVMDIDALWEKESGQRTGMRWPGMQTVIPANSVGSI